MKFAVNILAANLLSIVCVALASYLVSINHPGFAVALIVMAFWCAHTAKEENSK